MCLGYYLVALNVIGAEGLKANGKRGKLHCQGGTKSSPSMIGDCAWAICTHVKKDLAPRRAAILAGREYCTYRIACEGWPYRSSVRFVGPSFWRSRYFSAERL